MQIDFNILILYNESLPDGKINSRGETIFLAGDDMARYAKR